MNNSAQHQDKAAKNDSDTCWTDSIHPLAFESLTENINTDVVIVGGGMSGISVAYGLVKEGKKCVVLENRLIGEGETSRSSAHLTYALDARYNRLIEMYGLQNTRLVAQSHTEAINRIEKIIKRENIDCDFKRIDGYLFLHPSDTIRTLTQEFDASRRAGLSTELVSAAPDIWLKEKIAIRYPHQAQFHPLKYLDGLCKVIVNSGGKIFTNTKAISVDKKGVKTENHSITANHIVMATNTPFNDWFTMLAKQYKCKTYVIGATVHKGLISPALWWDSGDQNSAERISPYHYARIQHLDDEYDLLICGGEDHLTDEAGTEFKEAERFDNLERWARQHFPLMRDVVYKWTGEIMQPTDLLGYVGRNPGDENIYVITGDAGNGLTYGNIAGVLIPDLIDKRENPWEKLYNPSRLPTHAANERGAKNTKLNTLQRGAYALADNGSGNSSNRNNTIKKNTNNIVQ